jgi:hypothetical protein
MAAAPWYQTCLYEGIFQGGMFMVRKKWFHSFSQFVKGFVLLSFLVLVKPSADEGSKYRTAIREAIKGRDRSFLRSAPNSRDRAEDLVDQLTFRRLDQMEASGLRQASLKSQPWSDSYWPIYELGISHRYQDAEVPRSGNWGEHSRFLSQRVGRGPVASLSPAEKYDLLVGDVNFTLTRKYLEQGRSYADAQGNVESWMGLCHGWAAASMMHGRPMKTVWALAADGVTQIPFLPSDIKALSTALWSNASYGSRFIGGRCNEKNPDRSRDRVRSECLDTNPGTWHLAVVNQIGVSRRSFIMDATPDYEVWNHPVLSYSYRYYHPKSLKMVENLREAQMPVGEFPEDPLKGFRASGTELLAGVEMVVNFMVETSPSSVETDTEEDDAISTVVYRYTLELDHDSQILGGEWDRHRHPDFLWAPRVETQPSTMGDWSLDHAREQKSWLLETSIPSEWKSAARTSSSQMTPLRRIVEELIRRAR